MNKAQLANAIYEFLKQNGVEIYHKNNTGLVTHKPVTKVLAEETLHEILVLFQQVLAVGGKIRIPELGVFQVVDKKARVARNPKTGEKVKVPKGKRVKYTVSKNLKDIVNNL